MEEMKYMAYRTGCSQQSYLSLINLRSLGHQPFLDMSLSIFTWNPVGKKNQTSLKQVKNSKLLGTARQGDAGRADCVVSIPAEEGWGRCNF